MKGDTFAYKGFDSIFAAVNVVVVGFPGFLALLEAIVEGAFENFWIDIQKYSSLTGFGWVWFGFIGLAIWNFFRHRPVRVNEQGITSTIFGRPYKSVLWEDANRIINETTFELERGGAVEIITIVGNASKISVRSYIDRFEQLKLLISNSGKRFDIPVEVKTED